jgi:serine/threonine protein kinase
MSLPSGTRLGPYVIEAPLGAGGMGEVYRATDSRLGRTVAIKVLPENFASDLRFRERFEREARAISSLQHPHICVLYAESTGCEQRRSRPFGTAGFSHVLLDETHVWA